MEYITAGYTPFAPYRFFEEISAIPRGSRNEEGIADYLVGFARQHDLWHHRDKFNNVIIKKAGSAGARELPAVVLQAHTDMVCEKNSGTGHDFSTQPLQLYTEDGKLRARGTTLGADNGVGVAYMLALLDDAEALHPPLECVFTSMEEVGLVGALGLDPSLVEGRRLINMDSSPEGGILTSSAGGRTMVLRLPIETVPAHPAGDVLCIRIRGLQGGHSGADIGKGRANANKLMGRVLARLQRAGIPFEVAHIKGGAQNNAIPRECDAAISVCKEKTAGAKELISAVGREIQNEFAGADPDICISVEDAAADKTLDKASTKRLVNLLNLLPNGRQTMSSTIPGLVTLSLNQGVVTMGENYVDITYSLRAATTSALDQLGDDLNDLAGLLGAGSQTIAGYPAWEFREESPLRDTMLAVYSGLRGRDGFIQAVHGGVECAVFSDFFPEMDIVAIGPDMDGVHTPEEWLDLESYGRTYEYLAAVLETLAKP